MLDLTLLFLIHKLNATPVTPTASQREARCESSPPPTSRCDAIELGRGAKGKPASARAALGCVCANKESWQEAEVICALDKIRDALDGGMKEAIDVCSCVEGGNSSLNDACSEYHVLDARRDTKTFVQRVEKTMSPTEEAAFERVATAAFTMLRAFVAAETERREGEDEVHHQRNFVAAASDHLGRLDHASATAAEVAAADARLNATYQAVVKRYQDAANMTEDLRMLREAQRAWIAYRDAWVAFARALTKTGSTADERARATTLYLTKARADELEFGH